MFGTYRCDQSVVRESGTVAIGCRVPKKSRKTGTFEPKPSRLAARLRGMPHEAVESTSRGASGSFNQKKKIPGLPFPPLWSRTRTPSDVLSEYHIRTKRWCSPNLVARDLTPRVR